MAEWGWAWGFADPLASKDGTKLSFDIVDVVSGLPELHLGYPGAASAGCRLSCLVSLGSVYSPSRGNTESQISRISATSEVVKRRRTQGARSRGTATLIPKTA